MKLTRYELAKSVEFSLLHSRDGKCLYSVPLQDDFSDTFSRVHTECLSRRLSLTMELTCYELALSMSFHSSTAGMENVCIRFKMIHLSLN